MHQQQMRQQQWTQCGFHDQSCLLICSSSSMLIVVLTINYKISLKLKEVPRSSGVELKDRVYKHRNN
ncbi:hypothetical protein C5167_042076 [Papaver somniferum]|nr:hypothetical protein C5167_042076 [Papaver somniferum]